MGQRNFKKYEPKNLPPKKSERRTLIKSLDGREVLIGFNQDMGCVRRGTLTEGQIRYEHHRRGLRTHYFLEAESAEGRSSLEFDPDNVAGIYTKY